jgi:hypothetical protein
MGWLMFKLKPLPPFDNVANLRKDPLVAWQHRYIHLIAVLVAFVLQASIQLSGSLLRSKSRKKAARSGSASTLASDELRDPRLRSAGNDRSDGGHQALVAQTDTESAGSQTNMRWVPAMTA